MLTLLLGTDWKQNRHHIMQLLAEDVRQRKKNRILMVPELISHQMERELAEYAGDTASRYAEVLSFSRLAKRVAQDMSVPMMDCLDGGGRVVAMAAATRQLHSKLKAYAAVETKPEFLTGLLDAVDEFKRCCITSADLMAASRQTEGNLAQKLEELSLILEAYNSICARGKKDPRDQITWLLELLEDCDFAERHTFYFDAFPDFSRQNLEIVYHLILNSPNVIVSLNCDTPGSDAMAYEKSGATAADLIAFAQRNQVLYKVEYENTTQCSLRILMDHLLQGTICEGEAADCLHVYKAESMYGECCDVVERIVDLVENGCRYRDVSIVCADMQSYQNTLNYVLSRAKIPFYLSGTEDILEKSVIHTTLTAIDAALSGFDRKDVVRYLKSALSPISPDASDQMENYAILWSVNGNSWLQKWENHPRGMNEGWTERDEKEIGLLNEYREKAIQPLVFLKEGFQKAVSVPQQVEVLYEFLQRINLEKRLQALADTMDARGDYRNTQILNQLWEILIGALEQMHDVLNETSWDSETFTKLLKLLLSQYDVGTIPSVLDAVTVGSVSAMRCQKSRHLFVLGASEGALPGFGSSAGVLNDQERMCLISLGVPINTGAIDGLQTQFSEIREVFCGACESVSVYDSSGQPSFIYNRLKKIAGTEQMVSAQYGPALRNPWEAASILCATDADSEIVSEECQVIRSSVSHTLGTVSPEQVRALYGESLLLSASQIDKLADCRLLYFLRYGLKAKERKEAKVDPAEFGTYVHAVLEECGRKVVEMGGFQAVSLEKTLEIAAEISARYFAEKFAQIRTDRMEYHFKKNAGEVQQIVKELWSEMQETKFQAYDFELHFGTDGDLPAISIPGNKMDAQLHGFVDRVDCWNRDGVPYVRVVDYKTGKKDFDYCDIYNGLGLQMLLYLYALEDEGESLFGNRPVVAGVQYFPARVPYITADGLLTAEEAELAHSKEFRRKGLLLADDDVLCALETSEKPKRLNIKRNKDGVVSGDIATSHQFVLLKKYIFQLLRGIVDEIASGNVTANPYTRGTSHNPCNYCSYDAICHPEQVQERRDYKAISADRFWEDVAKEVE